MALDHYVGQMVVNFSVRGDMTIIELESDAKIVYDDEVTVRTDITGSKLLKVTPDHGFQRMIFGHIRPNGDPIVIAEIPVSSFKIADPSRTATTRQAAEDALPPDPSPERVAEGPVEAPESPSEPTRSRRKVRDAPQA